MFKSHRDVIIPTSSQESTQKTFFSCEFCKQGWDSEIELLLHKRSHNKLLIKLIKKKEPVCLICIKLMETTEKLIEHIKTDHLLSSENSKRIEREVFICDKCNGICFNRNMLKYHLKYYHKTGRRTQPQCPKCTHMINTKRYHEHLQNFSNAGLCPICLESFGTEAEMIKHTNAHERYCFCDICRKHFAKSSAFNLHMAEHKEKIKSIDDCTENGSVDFQRFFIPQRPLRNLFGWRTHARGLLLRDSLSICILCREICLTDEEKKLHLLNHQHNYSTDVKKETTFSCECKESFVNKILLKQHLLKCCTIRKKGDSTQEQSENV